MKGFGLASMLGAHHGKGQTISKQIMVSSILQKNKRNSLLGIRTHFPMHQIKNERNPSVDSRIGQRFIINRKHTGPNGRYLTASCNVKKRLSWIELSWAELSWPELSWIELNWAELSWVELGWAELSQTEFSWILLSWAELSWTELSQT